MVELLITEFAMKNKITNDVDGNNIKIFTIFGY